MLTLCLSGLSRCFTAVVVVLSVFVLRKKQFLQPDQALVFLVFGVVCVGVPKETCNLLHVFSVNIERFDQAFAGLPNFSHCGPHGLVLCGKFFMLLQILFYGRTIIKVVHRTFHSFGVLELFEPQPPANGIEIRADLAGKFEICRPGFFVKHHHCFLKNIPGVILCSIVADDKVLDHPKVFFVNSLNCHFVIVANGL